MAKKPTIKELQAEIPTLKRSNAAYKVSASIEKSTLFKKLKSELAECKMDFSTLERKLNKRNNEVLVLRRMLGIRESPTIETKEALATLLDQKDSFEKGIKDLNNECNQTHREKHEIKGQLNEVIQKQKAELAELKEKNSMQTKVIEEKEARLQDLMKAYNELITDYKLLKSKPIANNAGSKIRQLLGINPDATTEQMINAVHSLKTQVDRMTHEAFNANVDIETYRYLIGNIKKLLGVDKSTTIGTAIKNLQADLEAARKQEDKNGNTLSLIQSIINLNK